MATPTKSIEVLEKEVQANIEAISKKYLALMTQEIDDKDIEKIKEEKKELKSRLDGFKRDLALINSMKPKVDKRKEREEKKKQDCDRSCCP